eukprot:CAMPEP_0174864922 /NCGR_PEP_ID=MMETSP1114-20130205/59398_1 /TAXON_ID=312471 /ORGANISM="Neobodo designis, Strain CCAP 1951/1" /LENGTH=60 /DNA_ID=CAMNT_0016100039 /DNA_START=87 /DNA_END=266 /DNA_ORIENTATION=+
MTSYTDREGDQRVAFTVSTASGIRRRAPFDGDGAAEAMPERAPSQSFDRAHAPFGVTPKS